MSLKQSKLSKFLSILEKEKIKTVELKISRENWWSDINNHKILARSEILRNLISSSVACFMTNSKPNTTSSHKIGEGDFSKIIKLIPQFEFDGELFSFDRDSKTFLCFKEVEKPHQMAGN